jgi:hypothetical protein
MAAHNSSDEFLAQHAASFAGKRDGYCLDAHASAVSTTDGALVTHHVSRCNNVKCLKNSSNWRSRSR